MKLKHVPIDYSLLHKAKEFYSGLGYEYIETPWVVNPISSSATCEISSYIFILNDGKHMIGSGEQSFIELSRYTDSLEDDKKYMTITPCFRRGEDNETHAEQFMKLELFRKSKTIFIDNDSPIKNYPSIENIDEMCFHAKECFEYLGIWDHLNIEQLIKNKFDVEHTLHSLYDIESKDISYSNTLELGSYGVRRSKIELSDGNAYTNYYYGTGLALPRFQLALDMFKTGLIDNSLDIPN